MAIYHLYHRGAVPVFSRCALLVEKESCRIAFVHIFHQSSIQATCRSGRQVHFAKSLEHIPGWWWHCSPEMPEESSVKIRLRPRPRPRPTKARPIHNFRPISTWHDQEENQKIDQYQKWELSGSSVTCPAALIAARSAELSAQARRMAGFASGTSCTMYLRCVPHFSVGRKEQI